MHRPGCRLMVILLTAGGIGAASAEPNAEPAVPGNAPSDPQAGQDAGAAKAVLDARQKAVDDIRYGRVSPYYLFPPAAEGSAPRNSSPPEIVKDKKK